MADSKFVGRMPIRKDIEIEKQTVLSAAIQDLIYYEWIVADALIPSIHEKHEREIAQWEKERDEGEAEYNAWCEKEWAAGRATHTIEFHFWKRHPRPRKSGPLLWEVGEMKMEIVGIGSKKDKKDVEGK